MKKCFSLVFIAVATFALAGCGSVTVTKSEQCIGGGAVAGGVIAGPIGAVAGAVAGHQACK